MSNNQLIKSVAKGFALLELLVRSPDPLTLTQIANDLGHTKTTAQRLINTLLALGYLKRIEGKRYVPGNKVLSLSFQLLQKDNLYKQAQSHLEKISDQLGYSVTLSVLEGNEILVIYRKERARYLPYAIYTGSKLPPHCSATGKVLLSSLPEEKLENFLGAVLLTKVTPKTITDKKALIQEFNRIRKRGYSISNQEFSPGPVFHRHPLDRRARQGRRRGRSVRAHQGQGQQEQTQRLHGGFFPSRPANIPRARLRGPVP